MLTPIWRLKITSRGTSEGKTAMGIPNRPENQKEDQEDPFELEHLGNRMILSHLLGQELVAVVHPAEMESALIYAVPEQAGEIMDYSVNGTTFTVEKLQ